MGQYHIVVNLDRKEYLDPHRLGDGLKLREFGYSGGGTMTALAILLAAQNGRGPGDWETDDPDHMVGRWAGDRIAIVGDCADNDDRVGWDSEKDTSVYDDCENMRDVSAAMRALIEADGEFVFTPTDYGMYEREAAS